MTFEHDIKHKPERSRRAMAIFMAVVVFMALLLSTFFIMHEADHECSGEDCPVCALIQMCESNLRQLGSGAPAAAAVVSLAVFFMVMRKSSVCNIITSTPVSRKTRLNH